MLTISGSDKIVRILSLRAFVLQDKNALKQTDSGLNHHTSYAVSHGQETNTLEFIAKYCAADLKFKYKVSPYSLAASPYPPRLCGNVNALRAVLT